MRIMLLCSDKAAAKSREDLGQHLIVTRDRQACERMRAVVEVVVLTPVDGQLAIELSDALAGVLRFAEEE